MWRLPHSDRLGCIGQIGARRRRVLTRQRVIESAAEVFLEGGYAATTIREIATRAGVAVPTVELLFGTKPRLLKAAIDVAIAGDDEPVAVLDRDWTTTAVEATTVDELLSIVVAVVAAAQVRSAGLVLAVFEGARRDAELAELATQLFDQRGSRRGGWLIGSPALHRSHRAATERRRSTRSGC